MEVSDETLAIDLIGDVGPLPGHYLGRAHTRDWWRNEQYIPLAADTSTLAEWRMRGKKTALDLAKERMEEILKHHELSISLTSGQEEDIEKILDDARAFYKRRMEE